MRHEIPAVCQASKPIREQLVTHNSHVTTAPVGISCQEVWHYSGPVLTWKKICCGRVQGESEGERDMGLYKVTFHYVNV